MPARRLQEQVNTFAENLDRIHSMAAILNTVMAMIAPLGYTAAASGRFGHANPADALHFQNWHPEMLDQYVRKGWMRIDPAPIWALQSGMAIAVGELRTAIGKNHPGQIVWDEAAKFGYIGGHIIPQRAYDNTPGLVTFIGARDPDSVVERIALQSLAYIVFEHAETLSGRPRPSVLSMPPPDLSEKERVCLKHLVDGKSVAQIAKLMRVTPATVRFHSANLRKKVGVSSRAELTAFASAATLVPRG